MSGWTIPLDKMVGKAKGDLDKVARKIVLTAYRRVIMRTPVDTGRARGNWACSVGAPAVAMSQGEDWFQGSDTMGADKSGAGTVVEMQSVVSGEWNPITGEKVILANNVPYIGVLEDGRSKQAPSGMVKITVAELGGIAEDSARGTA